jgi:hypothetical protein
MLWGRGHNLSPIVDSDKVIGLCYRTGYYQLLSQGLTQTPV